MPIGLNTLKIPSSYFKKQASTVKESAPAQYSLKTPVKFEDGSRISGFTDANHNTAFGYTKNGDSFTVPTKNLSLLQIVPKEGNKTATKTEQAVRELADSKLKEVQKPAPIQQPMPQEQGMTTGFGGLDALIGSLF